MGVGYNIRLMTVCFFSEKVKMSWEFNLMWAAGQFNVEFGSKARMKNCK